MGQSLILFMDQAIRPILSLGHSRSTSRQNSRGERKNSRQRTSTTGTINIPRSRNFTMWRT